MFKACEDVQHTGNPKRKAQEGLNKTMSNHESAFIPVSTNEFQSPQLFHSQKASDVGLFAESLLYYESVHVETGSPEHFCAFNQALIERGFSHADLISIVESKIVNFVNGVTVHPFVQRNKRTHLPDSQLINQLYTMEEDGRKESGYFAKKFLGTPGFRKVFGGGKSFRVSQYDRFCRAVDATARVLETDVISDGVVKTSYAQYLDSESHAEMVADILQGHAQNEGFVYSDKPDVRIKRIPSASVENFRRCGWTILREAEEVNGAIWAVLLEVPLDKFRNKEQVQRSLRTLPLSYAGGAAMTTRAAGMLSADLYLANPLGQQVGAKLGRLGSEANASELFKSQTIVQRLGATVSFPDIQYLVNAGELDLNFVMKIRNEARQFRDWLRATDADKDPDLWHEYHLGVSKKMLPKAITKDVVMYGFLKAETLKQLAIRSAERGSKMDGADFLRLEEMVEESKRAAKVLALEEMFNYGAKLGLTWRPICFGRWIAHEIAKKTT